MTRVDPAAVRAALAEPRAVARALGLEDGARREGAGGLVVRCPVHGDRSPSLSLQVRGGTLSARCWVCGQGGDLLWLVAAVERLDVRRDFVEVLRRAAELAGGAALAPAAVVPARQEAPKLPEDVAAELFGRICEAGRLGASGSVERYLEGRGLLEAAREDGWAALPSLNRMLDIARGVWQAMGSRQGTGETPGRKPEQASSGPGNAEANGVTRDGGPNGQVGMTSNRMRVGEPSGQVSGGFAFSSPEDLLVGARLAFWGRDGELVTLWGRHRLVIPWRGPDGRIQALQRRLVDAPRKMRDGREEPRYVLTWAPRWPYGVERLGGDDGTDCRDSERSGVAHQRSGPAVRRNGSRSGVETRDGDRGRGQANGANGTPHSAASHLARESPVVFVEGAIDALALRCLRPGRCVPLGLPGTGGWVTAWAGLVGERRVFWGLDVDRAGDERAAKGEIDVAEAQGRLTAVEARAARRALADRLGAGAAACVLCGSEAAHLCVACGRVRPRGKDWGEVWERRRR